MSDYFTGSGDDGTTGLLGEGRVPKHDLQPSAIGSIDEASAALGLARAQVTDEDTKRILIQVQRDLYGLMAEVAAAPENAEQFRKIDAQRVSWLEEQIEIAAAEFPVPEGFVLSGDSSGGAALDLARTIVRRAERALSQLRHEGQLDNAELLRYLNRLSSLCFVLTLREDQRAGNPTPRLAKDS
jgi:cob(I)alamin adenosyltransferase